MGADLDAVYRIRLRSLMWAAGLLKESRHSSDVEAVAVAANWGLDAVYDLFEAYRLVTETPRKLALQDERLRTISGEILGGLLFVRGEKTHRAERVESPSPFAELPYDFAKFTDWTWSKLETESAGFAQRAGWYARFVQDRPLWVPLEAAEYWFLTHWPVEVSRAEAVGTPGWVDGVRPICAVDSSGA